MIVDVSEFFGYVRAHYPLRRGRIVLRTEQDWDLDLEPDRVRELSSRPGCVRSDFLVRHDRPYLFVKPCLVDEEGGVHWAAGANKLVILAEQPQDLYPHFFSGDRGAISEVHHLGSQILQRELPYRVYLPAGYEENRSKRYPVLYMHDGRNLFFPDEAFLGREWKIDDHLDRLDAMSLIDRTIVVGIHAGERRNDDYTQPGYERYGEALVDELKAQIDDEYRTLSGPRCTGVMGSSLGGVVSFYLAWHYPQVFGNVACLSSTFSWRDDLIERVRREPSEPRRGLRIYLDSGWPNDNYEVTLSLANALVERGFLVGRDLIHFAFPHHRHSEGAWASRVHLPLQLFSGKLRRAAERHAQPHPTERTRASRVFKRSQLDDALDEESVSDDFEG